MKSLIIGSIIFLIIALIITFIIVFKVKKVKKLREQIKELERQRNLIVSTPIMTELSKIEVIMKNEKLEDKYNEWKDRYDSIKTDRFSKITDMLINADELVDTKQYKEAKRYLVDVEMEVYKLRVSTDNLLDEIREITMSEEKNRTIVTKLKSKFRELQRKLEQNQEAYKDTYKYIELQFENIEKKFQDFEEIMEHNEYNEVVSLVKVLDEMIAHIGVVVEEMPDLLLLTDKIIPSRIKEITDVYNQMKVKNYPLEYLKVEYNIEQINNKIKEILDRVRILNLEDSMFELKTFLDYLDNLLNDFDMEKRSKKTFDELASVFKNKIIRVNKIVTDIYNQLDDIKNMYNLTTDDLNDLESVNKEIFDTNNKFNNIIKSLKEHKEPYSSLKDKMENLSNNFEHVETDLNECLKELGSMHDDELRAREQLEEVTNLLNKSKEKMREYHLPIISNNYFVELQEANDSINEIIKELEKTPITIKTLNIRVDTARDLTLKLYNTTNEMIKTARLAEMTIVYGNRYKALDADIERGLDVSSQLFFKGNYTKALETSIASINIVEPDIYNKMLNLYKTESKK